MICHALAMLCQYSYNALFNVLSTLVQLLSRCSFNALSLSCCITAGKMLSRCEFHALPVLM
eukprot:8982483-Lingulodinium_polyedra.AAC.1